MKDPLENISHDFKKDMSECPHCRYNTCRHECEECLKSELSLLREAYKRLEENSYNTTEKIIGPWKDEIKFLRSKVERYEKALRLVDEVWTRANLHPDVNFMGDDEHEAWTLVKAALSDVGSEGEKA